MAHYAQLTLDQRYLIQSLTHQNNQQKDTAKQAGVNPSTVSRELARYRQQYPNQPYQAAVAQQLCKTTAKRKPYKLQGTLEEEVLKGLRQQFSPEQISGVMALEAGHKVISHEAIYNYIYRQQKLIIKSLLLVCVSVTRSATSSGVCPKTGDAFLIG